MAKQEKMITQNRRGRPATGKGELIGVRVQPDMLAEVDRWRGQQPDQPTRPEALRRLAKKGLEG